MSGICRGQVFRITRAGRSPGHEQALVPAAEGTPCTVPHPGGTAKAVTDEIKTTGGIAVAGSGIVRKGAGA